MNIPIYRAKSNERKNSYVEGFLIGLDEDLNLCTIRTKDDYIGGEICYLHTLSIHFPDMLDSQGNEIFASLQKDGKGGDIVKYGEWEAEYTMMFSSHFGITAENLKNIDDTGFGLNSKLRIIEIQE
ncbi:hypothetical protein [Aliarcobacter cibarius]|uniref:YopX protein domain-containing protein n=1 Tax=Aliarcobacter cibarius TaxID=255507 RepID=A0ABY2V4N0_9BACT|nr:hypothetical protein [Aliarcobacter cibarius]TLS99921.1 hypothetical protein FE247_05160 [Aliarcobacter cibarius]TLT00330.1 hypothetical protein FE245_05590 [Aliarcobacter cibarius]